MNPGLLAGKHTIVTGGGRGIGAAIATALAQAGAQVTLLGRDPATLDKHRAALSTSGRKVAAFVCDVADEKSVRAAFTAAIEQGGPPYALVNNAGQAWGAKLHEMPLADWERMLRVNLTGSFLCNQMVLPAMLAANAGRIVHIASTAGLKGYSRLAAYCASKHGVIGLTRALSLDLIRTGITVNAVCPSYTESDMTRAGAEAVAARLQITVEAARKRLIDQVPRGSLIQPEEVADAVLWLCLPSAAGVTGQAIAVAGGEI